MIRRLSLAAVLALLAAFLANPISAADDMVCPTGCISAKPPTCAERIARAKRAGCDLSDPTKTAIVDHDVTDCAKCPPKVEVHATTVPAVCPDCPTCPGCPQPKGKVRPLFGVGLGYDEYHYVIGHVFTGVQFAPDRHGHNWQLQIGPSYSHRDSIVTTPGSPGHHGQPPIPPTTTIVDPPNFGILVSGVIVF